MLAHGPRARHVVGGIMPLNSIWHYPRKVILLMMVAKTPRHWNGFP